MDNRYKVIITSKRIFKEVELVDHGQPIRIGTTKNSNIRFSKEMFFNDFVIIFTKMNDEWMVACDDAVYLSRDGVMKLASKTLAHGDTFYVKYQNSNQELLKLEFMIDFDYRKKVYNLEVDTSNITSISIGGDKTYSIYINDALMKKTSVLLEKKNGLWHITDESSTYGVYKNGNKIKKEAEIKDYDFFSIIGYSFYYKHSKLYTCASPNVVINDMQVNELGTTPGNKMYPRFNRNTRIQAVISEEKIPVLDPSTMPTKPKTNILLSLLPGLAMLGITVGLRSVIGSGGSYIIISACTMTIGVVTSTVTIITGRKDYKKQIVNRKEKYLAYIKRKRHEIEAARVLEKTTLEDIYYSPEKEQEMVMDFTGNLFERTKQNPDFLDVRLGTGAVKAAREIEYKSQERLEVEDELLAIPEHLAQEYELIQKAPVICKLAENNAVGIVGNNDSLYELFKTMILDLAVRQYQTDVKVFIIADEEKSRQIMWTRFLPHVQNTDMNIRNIVYNDDSKTLLFEYLYKDLSQRENAKNSEPRCVVFVLDEMGIKKHPVSKYIEKAKDYGYTFLFFENEQFSLPIGCNQVIILDDNTATGTLVSSEDRNKKESFAYEVISEETASSIATKLAPVFSEEVSLESTLTKNISMFELLNIVSVEDLDLTTRYRESMVYKSMAAPLGVKAKGMVVSLDLHEKAHGPHGLVAGTTGSGKSEILQSYILSMVTLFHPYEVSFMIIDFKGGGMVNQFRDLPHLVGAITNIDGREIDRSLKSIKAELQKRQKYFAAANVNHIDAYIKLYKNGEVKEPIPHLIVIVDEFAELKAEQPEFMKELISAARIGRSLGVHLILATQKPAGQVNEQIWSNSRFKLCLKVQTKEDSNEVIKSPLAAEIKEPGRSYFQVGNNEIFELFQSAYSGCPANTNDADDKKEYEIYQVGLDGRRSVVFKQKRNKSKESAQTQLAAIVDYVKEYCEKAHIMKPRSICLPPLPEKITFKENTKYTTDNIMATIGLYDDPDSQYQGDVPINITEQNTMIIGSSQYGKTNLLQTIIRSLASSYSPSQVNFYIIDFASMVLKNFEGLNHCGGVVCSSDDEKLKNLFKLLNGEISKRKEKLVEVGVSSFASYLEAGYQDICQIVLIVDNLSALKELYLQDNDVLLNLCREGLSVGISVVITNAQTSGIGYRYLSNFSFKVGLYCNDSNEYSSILSGCRMKPRNTAGRCVLELNRSVYEAQTYLAFEGEKEIERVQEMKKFIATVNQRYQGQKAIYIPEIPKVLTDTFVYEQFGKREKNYKLCIGLDYSNVSPFMLDLLAIGAIGITGDKKSGKTNFITYMLQYLEATKEEMPSKVIIIDDFEKRLDKFKDLSVVSQYSIQADSAKEVVLSFSKELKARYEALMNGDDKVLEQAPLLLLLSKNNDVPAAISGDKEALAAYKQILAKYKSLKVGFIYCNLANAAIAYNAPDVMKMIKDARSYLAFYNLGEVKLMDLPLAKVREFKKPVEQGDGYYIKENSIIKLKTPLVSNELV